MKLGLLAAAWLTGVLIALQTDTAVYPVILLLLAVFATAFFLRLHHLSMGPVILAAVLLLALLRTEAAGSGTASMANTDGQPVTFHGRIIDDPEASKQLIKTVMSVDALDRGDGLKPFQTKVLAYLEPPPNLVRTREPPYFQYGDTLLVTGTARSPRAFADFDYASYLANKGVSEVVISREASLVSPGEQAGSGWRGRIFDIRRDLAKSLELALPVPQSEVAQALLLGQRGGLPTDLVEDFRGTGTAHLLAISGLHVGTLMIIALAAAGAVLGRRWGMYLLVPLALIWLYALVSGLPISVVRAAIMGTVYLAALGVGRPRSILPALALSAAVMVAFSPQAIQQVSFQLSFAAMAGIALAMPVQDRVMAATRDWQPTWLGLISQWTAASLIVSLAATLATWPLVALNFDRVPILGIFTTWLALPALPFILLGILATALAGLVHPAAGQIFGWMAWAPLSYLVELVSHFPKYTVSGAWVGSGLVWIWYITLGALLLLVRSASHLLPRESLLGRLFVHQAAAGPAAMGAGGSSWAVLSVAAVVIAAAVIIWIQVFSGPDGKLHVYFFDVGQGDSALIVTPTGKQILVDGGPESETAASALTGPLSVGDRSLDAVVLTHLDQDHSRGLLNVLERYNVAAVLVGMENPQSGLYPQWRDSLERANPVTVPLRAGYLVTLEPNVVLEVLNPPPRPIGGSVADQNNNSVVLRLVHGNVSFLLTGDIEAAGENHLLRSSQTLKSSVLKVAHHGSRTSTTTAFLREVNPSAAVLSAGEANRFGHPHPEVMTQLSQIPGLDSVYRTDRNGTIEFTSDGAALWVKTER